MYTGLRNSEFYMVENYLQYISNTNSVLLIKDFTNITIFSGEEYNRSKTISKERHIEVLFVYYSGYDRAIANYVIDYMKDIELVELSLIWFNSYEELKQTYSYDYSHNVPVVLIFKKKKIVNRFIGQKDDISILKKYLDELSNHN